MGELTHPKVYYEFFKRSHRGLFAWVIGGVVLVVLGLLIGFLPAMSALLQLLSNEGAAGFFTAGGWLIPVLAGAAILVLKLAVPQKYSSLTLFENGFALAGRQGKRQYPFAHVQRIVEYKWGHKRYTKIQLKDEQKPLVWDNQKLRDYKACAEKLQEYFGDYTLGEDFPQGFSTLELDLAEDLRLTDGRLLGKDFSCGAGEIQELRTKRFEERICAEPDVEIVCKDGRCIAVPPDTAGNRGALVKLAEYMLQEKKEVQEEAVELP